MYAHSVAGDLGDVLISERNLVTSISCTDEVSEVLGGLEAYFAEYFVHCQSCRCFGIDLALDSGVGNDLTGFVENYCLGIS